MYQVEEKDWKLFRKLLPGWQEAYMERLTKEYVELLSSDRQASDKFWALDKRIKEDKRRTGVLARDVSRSNLFQLIIDLIYEEAITEDDLKDVTAQRPPLYNNSPKYEIIDWDNYSPKLQISAIRVLGSKI